MKEDFWHRRCTEESVCEAARKGHAFVLKRYATIHISVSPHNAPKPLPSMFLQHLCDLPDLTCLDLIHPSGNSNAIRYRLALLQKFHIILHTFLKIWKRLEVQP